MPAPSNNGSCHKRAVLVTGSSGFIGTHLHRTLQAADDISSAYGLDIANPKPGCETGFLKADIRNVDDLKRVAKVVQPHAIFHLAAVAEVVIPFHEFPQLFGTNLGGTINVLDILKPKILLSASSSAVCGDAPSSGARATWKAVSPVGIYGMSKAAAEMVGRDWARETRNISLHFRFGNVVGPNCRGLIPYLVRHALQYPDGSVPARLRAGGRVQRDYVPVQHLIEVMISAMRAEWRPGTDEAFNIGTGRITTNGDVARIVQRVLRERGYKLDLRFDDPLLPGESKHVVLDVSKTTKKLGVPVPSRKAVVQAIEEGVSSQLELMARSATAQ